MTAARDVVEHATRPPTDVILSGHLIHDARKAAARAQSNVDIATLETAHAARRARGKPPSPAGLRELAELYARRDGTWVEPPPRPWPGVSRASRLLGAIVALSTTVAAPYPTPSLIPRPDHAPPRGLAPSTGRRGR